MNARRHPHALTLAIVTSCVSSLAQETRGEVLMTGDRALELAFPSCTIERRTVYLDANQTARVAELTGAPIDSSVVHPYVATCGGSYGGAGYFDVHRVRTLSEKVLVAIDATGAVRRVEVLSFDEPRTYLPRRPWYDQLAGGRLDEHLTLGDGIRGVAGATLSARAAVRAARQVLALHQVLFPSGRPPANPPGLAPTPTPPPGTPP